MARPYGKFSGRYSQKRPRSSGAAGGADNLRVKLKGRYDLEQTCLLLQRMIARLQDADVASIENCSVYLTPLSRSGERMALLDRTGKPTDAIELALPVSAKFGGAAAK